MNKAFTREPEPAEPRCPCGALGVPVGRRTLLAQLPEGLARAFAESAYYCQNARCPVAYFDAWGTQAPASVLRRPSHPKSPTSPLCSCFGITAGAIREEAEAGRKDLMRDLVSRAASDEARCETESPCGRSCVVEARRIFVRHFPAT
jgi:hypothetical protein